MTSIQDRANQLFTFLAQQKRAVTKDEMCEFFGWNVSTHERQIREVIALLGSKKPIISTSDRAGYKLATSIDECQHFIHECDSRISEICKRREVARDYVIELRMKINKK